MSQEEAAKEDKTIWWNYGTVSNGITRKSYLIYKAEQIWKEEISKYGAVDISPS